ncbi:MAG: hypothetical protein Q8N88_01610 [Nanoarchaeota archaeon]|nr:hypothetical protein [Nanoarchaeota archaeon]
MKKKYYMTDSELTKLFRVLKGLINTSNSRWKTEKDLLGDDVEKEIISNYYKLPEHNISRISKTTDLDVIEKISKDSFAINKHLFLPPLNQGKTDSKFIPTLLIDCSRIKGEEKICYRLQLYSFIDEQIVGLGYRFERHYPLSIHDYWHVQITKGVNTSENFPNCPIWIPTEYPCIPVKADNALSLLFSMLISLYGSKSFKMLKQQIADIGWDDVKLFEEILNLD